MRDGWLPAAVLCGAFGLWLALAPRRAIPTALICLVVTALLASALTPPTIPSTPLLIGCWAAALLFAGGVHLPRASGPRLALAGAALTGVLVGSSLALAGRPADLAKTLPLALLCLPAAWLAGRRGAIVVKVLASWIAAVALLSAGLTAVQGPISGADHID